MEVRGLGTRKTGNDQTVAKSMSYIQDICDLFDNGGDWFYVSGDDSG